MKLLQAALLSIIIIVGFILVSALATILGSLLVPIGIFGILTAIIYAIITEEKEKGPD